MCASVAQTGQSACLVSKMSRVQIPLEAFIKSHYKCKRIILKL